MAAAEQRIADRLPEIVEALIVEAMAGDVKAAMYLTDRIMGKVAQAVEHSGPDGAPIKAYIGFNPDDV